MINVGVIGLGMMGLTHLEVYAKRNDAKVIAIADANPKRLSGEELAVGNVAGLAQGGIDRARVKCYTEGNDLIADPDVRLVDICLPTPMHVDYALAALRAGKHVLIEKPLARTYADAKRLADAARDATGLSMCAMCMRFWPTWAWLKRAIDQKTYGKVLSAHFRRVASHPGGPFYTNGAASGGAILDLHIHDTDFVHYCFGLPKGVFSRGYTKITGQADHVVTQYLYDDVPLVVAEGSWAMTDGFEFRMQYTVNFERATAEFNADGRGRLHLCEPGKPPRDLDVDASMGYEHEIGYLLDCIARQSRPQIVTLDQAADSVRIVEAEARSINEGKMISL